MSPRPVSGNLLLTRIRICWTIPQCVLHQQIPGPVMDFAVGKALVIKRSRVCFIGSLMLSPWLRVSKNSFSCSFISFPGRVAQHHVETAGIKYFGELQGPVEESQARWRTGYGLSYQRGPLLVSD